MNKTGGAFWQLGKALVGGAIRTGVTALEKGVPAVLKGVEAISAPSQKALSVGRNILTGRENIFQGQKAFDLASKANKAKGIMPRELIKKPSMLRRAAAAPAMAIAEPIHPLTVGLAAYGGLQAASEPNRFQRMPQ